MTDSEKKRLEASYKRFRKRYFKGKDSYTGLELEECRQAFLRKHNLARAKG